MDSNCKIADNLSQGRYAWIDIARGLGLLMVIFVHLTSYESFANKAIFSFFMQMFFVLSGMLVHERKITLLESIKKKSYQLLLPSLIYIIISVPVYIAFFSDGGSINQIIRGLFYVDGRLEANPPIWFLIVLFEVYVMGEILQLGNCKLSLKAMLAVLFFILGYLVVKFDLKLLFGFDRMLVCLGFYVIGSLLPKDLFGLSRLNNGILGGVAFIIWLATGCFLNDKVSINSFLFGNYWLFIIAGIAGSIWLFQLAKLIANTNRNFGAQLSFWGKNTIFIIGTHYFWARAIKEIATHFGIAETII